MKPIEYCHVRNCWFPAQTYYSRDYDLNARWQVCIHHDNDEVNEFLYQRVKQLKIKSVIEV